MKWTDEQHLAITASGRHLCVDAGAGSGKTSVLVERIIRLLESGQATLDEIVAITFTEKAAGEMKDRLRRECRRRAPQDDARKFSFWRGIERQSDAARISTIHAFCTKLVKENALALGIDPDFRVLDESEGPLLRWQIVQNTVHDLLDASDPAALDAAAEMGASALMATVLNMLRHRADLAKAVAEAPNIDKETLLEQWKERLAVHERRKLETLGRSPQLWQAADDLRALAGQCSDPLDKMEILRRELLRCVTVLLGEADYRIKREAISDILSLNARGGSKKAWASEDAMAKVKEIRTAMRTLAEGFDQKDVNDAGEEAAAAATANLLCVYAKVAEALEEAKSQRLLRDFDDLILDAERMLREHPDLRTRTAQGIKHLLIDEFQDTDHRQLGMALMLAESTPGLEVFFVGDAKQSVYYFRGAEVEVFAEAQAWAAETIRLPRNFRSVPQLLAFVDEFFRKTRLLQAVEAEYQPMEAVRPAASGPAVEFLIPREAEKPSAEEYRRLEARMIAARLHELAAGATVAGHDGAPRPFRYGDAAILMRAMSDVHLYEQALRETGTPYVVASGRGFYERQEVMDIRNLLAAAADPYDEAALLGFLRGPIAGLSDEDLLRLCALGPLPSALQRDDAPEGLAAPGRLCEARELLAQLRARMELSAGAFMRYALDCTGYEAILLGQFLGRQRMANVRKLADLAEELSGHAGMNAAAFGRYLDLAASQTPAEGDAGAALYSDAVTLLTVHSAKGLEFPVVFVADAARGPCGQNKNSVAFHAELGAAVRVTDADGERYTPRLFRAVQERHTEKEAEEHARLLYVAMTRARDLLVVSGAPEGKTFKGSWLASFDDAFGVLSCADGARLAGSGWEANVRRALSAAEGAKAIEKDGGNAVFLPETLLMQTAPVAATQRGRNSFSVTEIARQIAGGEAPDRDGGEDEGEQNAPSTWAMSGADRGSLVHAFLERWGFAGAAREPAEAVCRDHGVPHAKIGDMVGQLCAMAERCAAHSCGQRIAADPGAHRERSFTLAVGDALVEGQIDLLLSDGTLVDYKTGRPNARFHEQYSWQMLLYALAVETLDGRPPQAGAVFYVDHGQVETVDVTPARLRETALRVEAAVAALRKAEAWPTRDEPYMIGVRR